MHPDDIDVYVERYTYWRTLVARQVIEDGKPRLATEEEVQFAENWLALIGIEIDPLIS